MTDIRTPTLRRRGLGVADLVFFTVAASAPLTVLAGGIPTIFAVTGNPAVPVMFLTLALALALFAVGYAAMSRHVSNAGAFYAYIARGLGQTPAVAAAFVALVAYNAIQIGLYGLIGLALRDFGMLVAGFAAPWWVFALAALVVVGVLGGLRIDLSAKVLAVLLTLECLVVVGYDIAAFSHPAAGAVSVTGLDPAQLLVPGVGAVFAFGVAGFIGFESAAVYSEECRDPRRTVARATYIALAFTGVFYALSAWAITVSAGTGGLQRTAAEQGPGLVFGALEGYWGPAVAALANILFLTSVLAALLSFHNGIARYTFALAREGVLPPALSRVGRGSGSPVAGSLAQSTLALVVVGLFAITGGEPLLGLFTWGSGIAGLGVLLLMVGTAAAVVGFFRVRPAGLGRWQRVVAPSLAVAVLSGLIVLVVVNFDVLLGPGSPVALHWLLPGLVAASAGAGAVVARVLRRRRPGVYHGIGRPAAAPPSGDVMDAAA
jgi:amino acid transporter